MNHIKAAQLAFAMEVIRLRNAPSAAELKSREALLRQAEKAKKYHHTVGVYANGDHKQNCVPDYELDDHVNYNIKMRPGRALFVDGVCKHQGYLDKAVCDAWEVKLRNWPMPKLRYPFH